MAAVVRNTTSRRLVLESIAIEVASSVEPLQEAVLQEERVTDSIPLVFQVYSFTAPNSNRSHCPHNSSVPSMVLERETMERKEGERLCI